eukprot:GHVS01073366.1.p1 GENE.GHVS01073366.1~~GHVS01073366.1.p1  ORF type:complete len:319 (-),score=59.71 GHVS01073366.1:67-912(-)
MLTTGQPNNNNNNQGTNITTNGSHEGETAAAAAGCHQHRHHQQVGNNNSNYVMPGGGDDDDGDDEFSGGSGRSRLGWASGGWVGNLLRSEPAWWSLRLAWLFVGIAALVALIVGWVPPYVGRRMEYWRWLEFVCISLFLLVFLTWVGDCVSFYIRRVSGETPAQPSILRPFKRAVTPGLPLLLSSIASLVTFDVSLFYRYEIFLRPTELVLRRYLRPVLILYVLIAAQYTLVQLVLGLFKLTGCSVRTPRAAKLCFRLLSLSRLSHPSYRSIYHPPLFPPP